MIGPQDPLPMFGFFKINFIIYLFCLIWVLLILIVPTVSEAGTIQLQELDEFENPIGKVGFSEYHNDIEKIQNPLSRAVYNSGDRMCHLKSSRSFSINDNQMPYCARCFGIFLGFAIGAGFATFIVIDLKLWLLVVGLVPIGLDGGLQYVTSYESNNIFRVLTGSLAGFVTVMAVGLITLEISKSVKYWFMKRQWAKQYPEQYSKKSKNT
jgi:uncharacterized membrane protein